MNNNSVYSSIHSSFVPYQIVRGGTMIQTTAIPSASGRMLLIRREVQCRDELIYDNGGNLIAQFPKLIVSDPISVKEVDMASGYTLPEIMDIRVLRNTFNRASLDRKFKMLGILIDWDNYMFHLEDGYEVYSRLGSLCSTPAITARYTHSTFVRASDSRRREISEEDDAVYKHGRNRETGDEELPASQMGDMFTPSGYGSHGKLPSTVQTIPEFGRATSASSESISVLDPSKPVQDQDQAIVGTGNPTTPTASTVADTQPPTQQILTPIMYVRAGDTYLDVDSMKWYTATETIYYVQNQNGKWYRTTTPPGNRGQMYQYRPEYIDPTINGTSMTPGSGVPIPEVAPYSSPSGLYFDLGSSYSSSFTPSGTGPSDGGSSSSGLSQSIGGGGYLASSASTSSHTQTSGLTANSHVYSNNGITIYR